MVNNTVSLITETLKLTCENAIFPNLERICCAQKWLAVKLSNGRCGYSFLFFGEHAVYGNTYPTDCKRLNEYIGMSIDQVFTHIIKQLPQSAVATKNEMLFGCFSEAIINALSQNINSIESLVARGAVIVPSEPCPFFKQDDFVVLIGAGMLMKESVQAQAEVHIVDMRNLGLFAVLDMPENKNRLSSLKAQFHNELSLPELLEQASVVCATGCTLANGTFWDIAKQLRKRKQPPREFILFGPTAQAPMELLAENGVTHVVTSQVADADCFMDELGLLPLGFSITGCQKYSADISQLRRYK